MQVLELYMELCFICSCCILQVKEKLRGIYIEVLNNFLLTQIFHGSKTL